MAIQMGFEKNLYYLILPLVFNCGLGFSRVIKGALVSWFSAAFLDGWGKRTEEDNWYVADVG